jgi:hypothetical protein
VLLFPTGSRWHFSERYLCCVFRCTLLTIACQQSTVTTTGGLVTSLQQHNCFLNNVQYSIFILLIMARHGTGSLGQMLTGSLGHQVKISDPVARLVGDTYALIVAVQQ